MNSNFSDLLSLFNEFDVKYLIVGGYAVIEYGEPRYTKDLDVWIWTDPVNAAKVHAALARFGAPLSGMAAEDFQEEGYVFQIGVAPVRIDILMSVDGLEFEDAWSRRELRRFGGGESWFISKQDLIVNKRTSGRPQDALDVQMLTDAE